MIEKDVKKSEQGNSEQTDGKTIIINQQNKSNGVGLAGFILALIGLFVGWVPILGWIVWLLGFILSLVGVFKKPIGMAVAGLVISLIGIILLIVVFGAIAGAAVMS